MAKLPETIGLLMNLKCLDLFHCEKLHDVPDSIGQLKLLATLVLTKCRSLETLPDSLGALTSLQSLVIVQCTSLTKLPTSRGRLSGLRKLRVEGCGALQPLPDSLRQLNMLEVLTILDCGSLEGLGALRVLQDLLIWECTTITELPGSCLMVVDSNFRNPNRLWNMVEIVSVPCDLKGVRVLEAYDCGVLRHVQDSHRGRIILQRAYNLPGSKLTGHVHLSKHLATECQADGMIGQLNALKQLTVTKCTHLLPILVFFIQSKAEAEFLK